jgi:hypothetical protein
MAEKQTLMNHSENVAHGGKRTGAGRKPALYPSFDKKLRATETERKEFMRLLTGDARKDFEMLNHALRHWLSMMDSPFKE